MWCRYTWSLVSSKAKHDKTGFYLFIVSFFTLFRRLVINLFFMNNQWWLAFIDTKKMIFSWFPCLMDGIFFVFYIFIKSFCLSYFYWATKLVNYWAIFGFFNEKLFNYCLSLSISRFGNFFHQKSKSIINLINVFNRLFVFVPNLILNFFFIEMRWAQQKETIIIWNWSEKAIEELAIKKNE